MNSWLSYHCENSDFTTGDPGAWTTIGAGVPLSNGSFMPEVLEQA